MMTQRCRSFIVSSLLGLLLSLRPTPALAQLDPLLFLKGTQPNIIVAVDTSNRMQRDAPTDSSNYFTTSNYYDPYLYSYSSLNVVLNSELNLTGTNTSTTY